MQQRFLGLLQSLCLQAYFNKKIQKCCLTYFKHFYVVTPIQFFKALKTFSVRQGIISFILKFLPKLNIWDFVNLMESQVTELRYRVGMLCS